MSGELRSQSETAAGDYEYLLWQIAGMARADLAPSERLEAIYRMATEKKTLLDLFNEAEQ